MFPDVVAFDSAGCPVSPLLMARIYNADAERLTEIAQGLPGIVRAAVAAFCYKHVHLRDTARRIASFCEPIELARSGADPGLAVLLAEDDLPEYIKANIALAPDEIVSEWAALPFE